MLKHITNIFFLFFISCCLLSCEQENEKPDPGIIQLVSVRVGTAELNLASGSENAGMPINEPIVISFAGSVNEQIAKEAISILKDGVIIPATFSFLDNDRTVSVRPDENLINNQVYTINISDQLKGKNNESFPGLIVNFKTVAGVLQITSIKIGDQIVTGNALINDVPLNASLEINFSTALNTETVNTLTISLTGKSPGTISYQLSDENKKMIISTSNDFDHFNRYRISISNQLRGVDGEVFSGYSKDFYTAIDTEPKFTVVSDEDLLTLVQEQTFKYFWDFAHPNSGMARERNSSGDLVTSGGSGFGIMAIIVGIERNFITRQQGVDRLEKILTFLESADRFHGVWSHWINGNTGRVIPFSPNDNGGDLVETSFLIQGLLTFRQYLNDQDAAEQNLIDRINTLWEEVEWDWYTRGGQNVLYWHWSPDKEWTMNMHISGWNESLIVYVLAASSPTHTISKQVYDNGWARNGAMKNGNNYYGIQLPLGYNFGGPLFFSHYSFLGLDPRKLEDNYANYWQQNRNHTLINREHAIVNPNNFVGYSANNWGFTASDNHIGYSAHSPTNDQGVITPTAALSSFPYTPDESMEALKFFYYTVGDKLWGSYGFYDAYNTTQGWVANSYLAIDQGPIIVMIENYRTGLLWDLFMSSPEVQAGLTKLGFSY
jgi:hypothetical protein